MTQTEALLLALDWFKCYQDKSMSRNNAEQLADEVIVAIKAALEAKDEPVACKECHLKDTVYDLLADLKVANLKLSVRPQRTWVGLTNDERSKIWGELPQTLNEERDACIFAEVIELYLKECNK